MARAGVEASMKKRVHKDLAAQQSRAYLATIALRRAAGGDAVTVESALAAMFRRGVLFERRRSKKARKP